VKDGAVQRVSRGRYRVMQGSDADG
jgi:hypothetical protein